MNWAIFLSIFIIFGITIVTIERDSVLKLYNQFRTLDKNKILEFTVYESRKFNKDVEELVDLELERRFVRYMRDFNKNYNKKEYKRRFENFKASLKDIARLNKLENNTVFGLTKFSDMSKEEFADRMLLKHISSCQHRQRECYDKPFEDENNQLRSTYGHKINSSHDWRKHGVVKPVLDQKFCQGCWAFSIVGVLESMSAIQLKDYRSRSIEELIDCSSRNHGCYNGSVIIAMNFICDCKLEFVTAEEYPLTLSMEQNCKLPTGGYSGRRVKQFEHMCYVNEDRIVELIATHGPLVVAVDASNWMNYMGGVITRACTRGVANHVVQIVGYEGYRKPTVETPIPYYIVRNSWGQDWGDEGYVKIAIHGNVCGISEQVTAMDALNNTMFKKKNNSVTSVG